MSRYTARCIKLSIVLAFVFAPMLLGLLDKEQAVMSFICAMLALTYLDMDRK